MYPVTQLGPAGPPCKEEDGQEDSCARGKCKTGRQTNCSAGGWSPSDGEWGGVLLLAPSMEMRPERHWGVRSKEQLGALVPETGEGWGRQMPRTKTEGARGADGTRGRGRSPSWWGQTWLWDGRGQGLRAAERSGDEGEKTPLALGLGVHVWGGREGLSPFSPYISQNIKLFVWL